MKHDWMVEDADTGRWRCRRCALWAYESGIASSDKLVDCVAASAPVTDIAAARVAKAAYANAVSPSDLLRAVIAELEGGMACSHIVVVLALEEQEVASVALRLGGVAGYHTRLGALESAKDVLKRESVK